MPTDYDAENCGACGHVCGGGLACTKGTCVKPASALPDGAGGAPASTGLGGASHAGGVGGGSGAPHSGGAGVAAGAGGTQSSAAGAGGAGAAGVSSGGSSGGGGASGAAAAGTSGAGGGAPLTCAMPLVACGTKCVDLTSDDAHCGSCKAQCPTGICQGSACVGAAPAHRIVLGSSVAPPAVEARILLGNAAFLGSATAAGHWHVLGFDAFASTSVSLVDGVLVDRAASHGISDLKVVHTKDVPLFLATMAASKIDAVIFYDAPNAPAGSLGAAGAALATAMSAFRGVAVVITGGEGRNEMWALAAQAGLFPVTGFTPFPAAPPKATLDCPAPLDPLAVGLAGSFPASPLAGSWDLPPGGDWDVVVRDHASEKPVVAHRAFLP